MPGLSLGLGLGLGLVPSTAEGFKVGKEYYLDLIEA